LAARAAASVYATLGVAAATLVAVGGILAGPTLLECSTNPDGFGACLRDKMAEGGLIGPDVERAEKPDLIADISSEPSVPEPQPGWMEAAANEYEPPVSVPVELAGGPAAITAAEIAPEALPLVEIEVAPVSEFATAALVQGAEPATVELEGPASGLVAEGASSTEAPAVEVALVGPEGAVTAVSPPLATPLGGTAVLTEPGELAPGAVTVLAPPSLGPVPVELRAEATVDPVPEPAQVVIEFNPSYPNVLVLPPPAEGDNSSFRSLQLN
jgi:hypothetical protein